MVIIKKIRPGGRFKWRVLALQVQSSEFKPLCHKIFFVSSRIAQDLS
jgi:hypothetical protein